MKSIYKYIPYEDFTIQTNLGIQDVCDGIETIIETDYFKKKQNMFRDKSETEKQFGGNVFKDRFSAESLGNRRNSFRPLISGNITKRNQIITIRIKQTPLSGALLFLSFWLSAGIFGAGAIIYSEFQSGNYFIPFFAVLFPASGYLIAMFGFKSESIVFRRTIQDVFEK